MPFVAIFLLKTRQIIITYTYRLYYRIIEPIRIRRPIFYFHPRPMQLARFWLHLTTHSVDCVIYAVEAHAAIQWRLWTHHGRFADTFGGIEAAGEDPWKLYGTDRNHEQYRRTGCYINQSINQWLWVHHVRRHTRTKSHAPLSKWISEVANSGMVVIASPYA